MLYFVSGLRKTKAQDLQAGLEQRLSYLKGEIASVEAQAEENRQRVLVLQSEWQAIYDKTGEDTDVVPENESIITRCVDTNVPTEQFVSAMDNRQRTFLETMSEAANERGLQLADKVTLMLQGQTGQCSDLSWGQDWKDVL